ncbi:MAG: PBP1A family penicillin-binding protein [Bacteriovoracaceae bacterium]|nr:PBP1A family penicillin-binding protein [Bacteriovoracaceae bacterium]
MKRLLKVIMVLAALGLLGVGALVGMIGWVASDLPQINSLADYRPPMNSKIVARDGTVLLEIGKETRDVVPFKDIPARVVGAFLAAEDDNFYNHSGVDYLGIARAFMVNLKEGRLVQGGSTITQQVAKSLLLSKERTLSRKIKDFLLAQKIEEKFSKEDILFLYLNQIYLGGGYYGVKSAVNGYFEKELKDATVAESALIAGLLVAPGRYSPYVSPMYAKRRQLYVLKRMYETNKITEEEYEAAKKEDIKMRLRSTAGMKGGHFTDWVRQQVIAKVGEEEFLTEGFEVVTTLDWSLQERAEKAVVQHVKELDKRQGYKGPLGHLPDQVAIDQELERQRQRIYKDVSSYFYFGVDGQNRFEFSPIENEWQDIQKYYQTLEDKKDWVAGNNSDDRLVDLIKKNETYPAIVLSVDDSQKAIYASVGGARVIIPEIGFSWAHARKLDEEPKWFPPLTKPSLILKPGDQIQIRVTGENQNIWSQLSADYKKKKIDVSIVKFIQAQKMIVAELDQRPEAEGAIVALDPKTGNVMTMVGGVDFGKSQFNRALQAARQPGSSFKPFIYAAALEEGYNPSTIILDTPQALGGVNESLSWKPKNYDGEFMGQMTFRKALEVSRNIPTIKLVQDLGVSSITSFVERLGVKVQLPKDMSIGLGSFGISLIELVKGYAVFANGGKRVKLQTIISVKDREGKKYSINPEEPAVATEPTAEEATESVSPLQENPYRMTLNDSQVYDPRLAFIMTRLLQGVVQFGTATAARGVSAHIAGKTGTTNNYVDALFAGFSPNIVAAAWVGFDNNQTLGYGETGGKTALPIWSDFMHSAIAKYGDPEFVAPEGIVNILINKETGKPLRNGETAGFMESFAEGMDPLSGPKANQAVNTPDGEEAKPTAIEDGDYYMNQ